MQKKLPDPTPYSCVVLITSGLSHIADQVNCGESSVTIFGYDNSYFIATPSSLDEYFLRGRFCVMFVVTVATYKVKIYTLILQVILFKRISCWS